MNNLLLPVNDEFVEVVARSIARNRLHRDMSVKLEDSIGIALDDSLLVEMEFDRVFEMLWTGTNDHDEGQRYQYRSDARAAISAINLKLLTSTE